MTDRPKIITIERKKDTNAQDALQRAMDIATHDDATNAMSIIFLRDGSWVFERGDIDNASQVIGILERIKFDILTNAQKAEEE
ncbi:hypothetical protein [Neokomagataea thailandica]|uniref:Uncharacterized protein n=1 Tax=Neokomagataea tanensis NBRC 106556 TaxID=1223519 RepID=A0ABQ0QJG0_9PROT|nr:MULTISPECIES: hypothetical protein [Neokomagataea]GBR46864.1 hypothetical protein AA106556_1257 [Neokomagataea tanensis NBRC 106556]